MPISQEHEYLEYLERQFSGEASTGESAQSNDGPQVKAQDERRHAEYVKAEQKRWRAAEGAVLPRSKFGILFGLTADDITRSRLLLEGLPALSKLALVTKRIVDISSSVWSLILLAPVLLVVGILIKAHDGGPILYAQTRVGVHGEIFYMYKFRTMHLDSKNRSAASLTDGPSADGTLFKMKNDPRITPIGAVLRKYSIDELPQFLNVLRGDMSLIGPRPPLVSEMEAFDRLGGGNLLVKPGITGLWAIAKSSNMTWAEHQQAILFYAENWSVWLDFLVLLRTFGAAFRYQPEKL
ncbi:sugar transferase [Kocuria sp. LHG3120]|uniref:sugar transferase n=1 Tax=Kocuria sp. LHG3120 TaxID=2804590 RepID=UPI003CF290B6